jgi:hypothetical protein
MILRKTAIMLTGFAAFAAPLSAADTIKTSSDLKMLFRANGEVSLGFYLYGKGRYTDLNPGYRSDLLVYTDLVSFNGIIVDLLTGATTRIARLPEAPIKLDKIRYSLSPGVRYAFKKYMMTGLLFHECLHTISRNETNGSTWWNIIQIGGGTKGAYHFYLIEKYNNRDFSLRNSFDAQINAGAYLQGHSLLAGQNHHYRYETFGLVRYHLGLFRNQTFFFDLTPNVWYDTFGKFTYKLSGEINYVILAHDNIATLYFNHCFHDDNPYDNEHALGALGFKVIF